MLILFKFPKINFNIKRDWPFALLFLLLLLLIIYFICVMKLTKKNKKAIKESTSGKNNIRLFTLYYKENYIYVVDKKNFKGKKKESFDWFYKSFTKEDQIKVKIWINEIIENDKSFINSISVHTKINTFKKAIFSVLSCTSYDLDSGIIHIESHLFPNISTKKIYNKKISIISKKEITSIFLSLKQENINIFLISLYIKNEKNRINITNRLLITLLLSRLKRIVPNYVKISAISENEIALLETKTINKNKSIALAHRISNEISKILFLNSLQDNFTYRIGIANGNNKNQSFDELIENCREMCLNSLQNHSNFIVYNTLDANNEIKGLITKEKLKALIKQEAVNVEYNTILNCNNGHVEGFYTNILPKNNLFKNINDIQEISLENNLYKELMEMLYTKINSVYVNRYFITSDKRRLFIDFNINEYQDIIDIVNNAYSPENVKTVFILNDIDIIKEASSNNKFLNEAIETLSKCDKLRLGLRLTSTSLELSDDLLQYFNYFIVDYKNNFANVLSSIQDQILLQSLVNNLLEIKNVKLIGVNLTSWQAIEYFSSLGFHYVSGPVLGQQLNSLPPIETKKINKLMSFNE